MEFSVVLVCQGQVIVADQYRCRKEIGFRFRKITVTSLVFVV